MTKIQRDIYERIYSSHWFLTSYNGVGFVHDFSKIGGGNFISEVIYVMENEMCRYIFRINEFEAGAKYTAEKLINNGEWREGIYRKIDFFTKKYFKAGEKLRKTDLSLLSDRQLVNVVKKIIYFQHYHQIYSVLVNGLMLDGRNHLSNLIRKELEAHLGKINDFDAKWSFLTLVTKMSLRQKKEYEIACLAKRSKYLTSSETGKRLLRLHEKYCWLDYNNMGPATTLHSFRKELTKAKRDDINFHLPQDLNKIRAKQQKIERQLKLNSRAKFLLHLARYVIWQKALRKDMQYHGFYCCEHLFRELALRFKADNWQDLSFLFPWEVEGFIKNQKPLISELKQRRRLSCFIINKKEAKILVGPKAKKFIKDLKLEEYFFYLQEAKGQCAFVGKAKGRVKIVQSPADLKKMGKGDILISQATSPDLLPAMKKAAAIVTNTGGLICHAAIISRELKIPCIVGTGKATLIFKDGDRVEVDATKGIIKKI